MNLDKEYKEDKRFFEYWTLAEAIFWCCFRLSPRCEEYSLFGGHRFKSNYDEIDFIKGAGFIKKTLIDGMYSEVDFEPYPDGYEYIEKPYGHVERIYTETEELKSAQRIWLDNFKETLEPSKRELFMELCKGRISARGFLTTCKDKKAIESATELFNDFDICEEIPADSLTMEKIKWSANTAETKNGNYIIIHVNKEELLKTFPIKERGSNNLESQPQKNKTIKIVDNVPVISPSMTATWREDVQMAVNHYYNEKNVAPVPRKLCTFIQNKKENNEQYAQHIRFIKYLCSLTVIKDGLNEEVDWGTFGKEVSAAKGRIKL